MMTFDRRVSPELMALLGPGGPLAELVTFVRTNDTLDLQLRRPGGKTSRATIYDGHTAILNIDEQGGTFTLRTNTQYLPTDPTTWATPFTPDGLGLAWKGHLEVHLGGVMASKVDPRWRDGEGTVVANLSRRDDAALRSVQREAVPSFPSATARNDRLEAARHRVAGPLVDASCEWWWPAPPARLLPKLGPELDLLGIDDDGRLLVIEAKTGTAHLGIVQAPLQVMVYADLFAELSASAATREAIADMRRQRVELGLAVGTPELAHPVRLAPIIGIGPGWSRTALARLQEVAAHVATADPVDVDGVHLDPIEVWLLDASGSTVARCRPTIDDPAPAGRPDDSGVSAFAGEARTAAIHWKQHSPLLPDDARQTGQYRRKSSTSHGFCLPIDPVNHTAHNLLPDAREVGLARFAAAGIPWHQGIDLGPTSHLVSSQIQCVNALAPFVADAAGLADLFGSVLPIAEVTPLGSLAGIPTEQDDLVAFEWIPAQNHLHEYGTSGTGTRGANNTSADAVIRYRNEQGGDELALIEWKYTEEYGGHTLGGGPTKHQTRVKRYLPLWKRPDCPLRTELFTHIEELFVEPFYQLLRLQLLASELESDPTLGLAAVRVVYAAPARNQALRASVPPGLGHVADGLGVDHDVFALWPALLTDAARDRWVHLDTATVVSSPRLSPDFRARYGHLATGLPTAKQGEDP